MTREPRLIDSLRARGVSRRGFMKFCATTASLMALPPSMVPRIAAGELSVSPYPLCIAVLIGASSAFATPISTPVVTLVVEPGGYSFKDFLKPGTPLLFLSYFVALFLTPWVFPW